MKTEQEKKEHLESIKKNIISRSKRIIEKNNGIREGAAIMLAINDEFAPLYHRIRSSAIDCYYNDSLIETVLYCITFEKIYVVTGWENEKSFLEYLGFNPVEAISFPQMFEWRWVMTESDFNAIISLQNEVNFPFIGKVSVL